MIWSFAQRGKKPLKASDQNIDISLVYKSLMAFYRGNKTLPSPRAGKEGLHSHSACILVLFCYAWIQYMLLIPNLLPSLSVYAPLWSGSIEALVGRLQHSRFPGRQNWGVKSWVLCKSSICPKEMGFSEAVTQYSQPWSHSAHLITSPGNLLIIYSPRNQWRYFQRRVTQWSYYSVLWSI